MSTNKKRPVIGLSSGTILPEKFVIPGMELVSLSRDYIDALEAVDAVPLVIPVTGNPEDAAAVLASHNLHIFFTIALQNRAIFRL